MQPTPRLSIELIPRSAHGMNLRTTLKRSAWETIKRLTVARAAGRCEVCCARPTARRPLETHEVWGWDAPSAVQRLERTVALCHWCHHAKHIALASKLGVAEQTRRHIRDVNGWCDAELVSAMKDAMREWSVRSTVKWTLDHNFDRVLAELEAAQQPA